MEKQNQKNLKIDADLGLLTQGEILQEIQSLRDAIRQHMLEVGNERCHESDTTLYQNLPEGDQSNRDLGSEAAWMANCKRYYRTRNCGESKYTAEILDYTANLSRKWEEDLLSKAELLANSEDEFLGIKHIDQIIRSLQA